MWFLWCESCNKYMLHDNNGHEKFIKQKEINKTKKENEQREQQARDDARANAPDTTDNDSDTSNHRSDEPTGLFAQYITPYYCDTDFDSLA